MGGVEALMGGHLAVESARRRGARPSQLEEEWLMQRAAEVKARDA
tara:strand:- start:67 stop:201 length:135 start_codon:yes stop_codon:yes gene_type:complete